MPFGEKPWSLVCRDCDVGVFVRTALHENAEEKKQERILLQDEAQQGLESIVGSPRHFLATGLFFCA